MSLLALMALLLLLDGILLYEVDLTSNLTTSVLLRLHMFFIGHFYSLIDPYFLKASKCPSKTSKVLKFLQGSSMVLKSSQMSLKVLKGSQRSTKILKGPQMSQNVLNSLKQGFSKVHKSPQRCNKGFQRCLKVPKGVQSSLKVPKDAQRSLKFSEGHKIPFYSLSNISLNVRFPL